MKKNLILVGGGGHCKSLIEITEHLNYNILGILERPSELDKTVLGRHKIIGVDKDMPKYVETAQFIVSVGNIKDISLRKRLYDKIITVGGSLATIIAQTAHVSQYSSIGEGTAIMNFAMVNADTVIGKNCILNTYCNIEHDVTIGDFCHISTGAMVNGNCKIGNDVFIGSNATIANGISICDGCIIGAGAVVIKDITTPGLYVGNPAKLK